MEWRVVKGGWIVARITPEYEENAKSIRAARDRRYGNIYIEAPTDARWVGDLGELVFNSWLQDEKVTRFEWIRDDAAGKADFILLQRLRIGVKAVKRQGPPKPAYTAQITAQHATEPIDHFFFMSYDITRQQMWLLGGIDRARFLREARYYGEGEWVHEHYQIRPGHEIYNIELDKLISPRAWLIEALTQALP